MAFTLQQRMAALASAQPPGSTPGGTMPHVCNWVAGKSIIKILAQLIGIHRNLSSRGVLGTRSG